MTIKVLMTPHVSQFKKEESGIRRVVEAYSKYLPEFDIELVKPDATTYDLKAVHISGNDADIVHSHGLYWTADYDAETWQYEANRRIVESLRTAKEVSVPSSWVAEAFQRDMRFTPHVIGHGIEWQDWQHNYQNQGFVLWNKNRTGDVCDPTPMNILADKFIDTKFVTTFGNKDINRPNIAQTGLLQHSEMKKLIQSAGVYLSTTKETFGIGVLEAMAAGVPVLGFKYGGNVDLIEHGINGYLAEVGNYEDLIEGLNFCFEYNKLLGSNGKELAKKWTWENACRKVADMYLQALTVYHPSVSVIIPVYNKSIEQVQRAIESCINQSFKPKEIIVIDDGSDNPVEPFSHPLVKYITQNNQGVANARNNGIAQSTSKYICCLDADDYIGNSFLQTCIKALECDPALGLAYTGIKWFSDDGKSDISHWPTQWDFDRQVNYTKRQNQVPTCNVFRRKIWERLGGYKQRYAPDGAGAEDAEFWTRIGAYGWKCEQVEPVPTVLNTYHVLNKQLKQPPTKEQMTNNGIASDAYDITMNSLLHYYTGGSVGGNREYREPDWLAWHPFAKDNQHPFASYATPKKLSHPVRQYDEPLVSIIIPVGSGHEKDVINALDSLEAQTFRKWEVIVVDDTRNIEGNEWYNLVHSYPYVKFVNTSGNKGAGYARNRGIEIARAPFILFLDADDILLPDCIQKMLDTYAKTKEGVYTDHYGSAIVSPELAQQTQNEGKLEYYNPKTGEMLMRRKALDFDCGRALRQPENNKDIYIWNNITTLIPKQWHDDIGGFDENMGTWEDWDYWLRMVHSGKCFTRLPEILMTYRYHTGQRRNKASADTESGRQIANSMIEYLTDKYKGVEKMGCSGCGGKKSNQPLKAAQSQGEMATLSDNQFVKAKYLGRRGNHHIIGAFHFDYDPGLPSRKKGDKWVLYYGYAGEGFEHSLVHREDIRLMVGKWQEIVEIEPPPATKVEIPIPKPIAETRIAQEILGNIIEKQQPAINEVFNLQKLPGITPTIEKRLKQAGFDTVDKIKSASIEELTKIKGIAKNRASTILKALSD